MKKNTYMRAAMVLLALTLASTSVLFTNAKYLTEDSFSNQFTVYSLYSITSVGTHQAPAGNWAFYVRGQTGAATQETYSNSGLPGVLWGIYYKTTDGQFTIGSKGGGSRRGSGGSGGACMYIFKDNTTTIPDKGVIVDIVAVAGGGGGRGRQQTNGNWNGGHAGGYGGINGPYGGSPAGWSQAGFDGGYQGRHNGTSFLQSTSHNSMSGGGGGAGLSTVAPITAIGGNGGNNTESGTDRGDWFHGGNQSGSTAYDVGGGGCGIWGGGSGTWATIISSYSGGGGGGSSYTAATAAVPDRFANPQTYYHHAVNYFNDLVDGSNDADLTAILVWLGP